LNKPRCVWLYCNCCTVWDRISYKLFTPEVVWPSKSVRGTTFGLCMCTAQLWARF